MIPSTDLRLKTMMRAMTESILPALDPEDSLAQEQAGLMIGHINALILQKGNEHNIDQEELLAITELARFLLSIAEGEKNTQTAISTLSNSLDGESIAEISKAVEHLISVDDASRQFKDASWKSVLNHSVAQSKRGRTWFQAMGF